MIEVISHASYPTAPAHVVLQESPEAPRIQPQEVPVSHALVRLRLGQAAPPFAGCVLMVRVPVRVPRPQRLEQPPQFDQADTAQSVPFAAAVAVGVVGAGNVVAVIEGQPSL